MHTIFVDYNSVSLKNKVKFKGLKKRNERSKGLTLEYFFFSEQGEQQKWRVPGRGKDKNQEGELNTLPCILPFSDFAFRKYWPSPHAREVTQALRCFRFPSVPGNSISCPRVNPWVVLLFLL